MSKAVRVHHGLFGRVAVLEMSRPLVVHAHSQAHVLFKIGGIDSHFVVRDVPVPLGDVNGVLIDPWAPHSYLHPDSERRTLVLAVYVEPLWLAAARFGSPARGRFPVTSIPRSAALQRLVCELTAALAAGAADDLFVEEGVAELLAAVDEVAADVARAGEAREAEPREIDRRIARCIGYMRENLAGRDDLALVASRFGLSRPHMFHLFQRDFHVTPHVYWNTLRMDYALKHLTAGSLSIGAIAQDLGFVAQGNFTRFFQQIQGVAPKDYQLAAGAGRGRSLAAA